MATNNSPTALERYPKSFEPLGRGQPNRMLRPGRVALRLRLLIRVSPWLAARISNPDQPMNPTPKEQPSCPAPGPISAFVGIDWADAKHDICLLLPDEEDGRHMQIENTPEALNDWLLKLIAEFGTRGNIYVATEKARGALLYTLMQYPQLTLFPLNSEGHRKAAGDPAGGRGQKRPLG